MREQTIDGYEVKRSPKQYPYSFTRYCIYKGAWRCTDETVYSDRLCDWYPDEYDDLRNKMLGRSDYFKLYEPQAIEKFLCTLFKKNILLTGIEEACNFSTGYPYYIFYFRAYIKKCIKLT